MLCLSLIEPADYGSSQGSLSVLNVSACEFGVRDFESDSVCPGDVVYATTGVSEVEVLPGVLDFEGVVTTSPEFDRSSEGDFLSLFVVMGVGSGGLGERDGRAVGGFGPFGEVNGLDASVTEGTAFLA